VIISRSATIFRATAYFSHVSLERQVPASLELHHRASVVKATNLWRRRWTGIAFEGNWKQTKGKIKEKWGQLTDDDLAQINGKRDQLEGKIQERYGLAKDRARKDVEDWLSTMN